MMILHFSVFILACTASAMTLAPQAVCNAKNNLGCPSEGVMGCEKNGGHSVSCMLSN
jgi:hypothetical protein